MYVTREVITPLTYLPVTHPHHTISKLPLHNLHPIPFQVPHQRHVLYQPRAPYVNKFAALRRCFFCRRCSRVNTRVYERVECPVEGCEGCVHNRRESAFGHIARGD